MLIFVLLVLMVCVFGVCSWRSYEYFMGAEQQEHKVVELIGVIKHLDEVLTMSAHMAAVTGDPQWEQRYKTFEPQLDAAITEASTLFPESLSKAADKVNLSNTKLAMIENKVFDLVRQEEHEKAISLLNDLEYTEQKYNYNNAVSELTATLWKSTQDRIVKFRRTLFGFTIITAVLGALTLSVWGIMLQMQKRLTERIRGEQNLWQVFQRNQKILETSIDGFCIVGLDGKMLEVNSSLCKITGYLKEELLGMKIADIEVVETAGQIVQHMDKVIKQGYDHFEAKHRRKDGKIINIEVSTQYYNLDEDKFFFSFFRDITKRKKVEKLLRASQAELSAIYENAPAVMILMDRERRVLKANCDYAEFADRPIDGIVGLRHGEALRCFHSLDVPEGCGFGPFCKTCTLRLTILDTFETGNSHHQVEAELPLIRGDNYEEKNLLVSSSLISVLDKPTVLVHIQDITERKRAEIELENYKEKVLKAQRHAYIGSMGAIMAHQVNQPLTMINILLDRVLNNAGDGSCCPVVIKDIEESMTEVQKAVSIIRKFRQHSKGSVLSGTANVNVSAVADRIISVLSEKAKQAKMRISIKNMRDLPEVETNEIALEQIFLIVIQNAIEAADGRKSHKLDITGKLADSNIELQFADNCCGIAPENLDRIFEPFFSTKTEDNGLGLGLDIVQQILMNCGGQIRVESQPGKGATFYVTLPIKNNMGI